MSMPEREGQKKIQDIIQKYNHDHDEINVDNKNGSGKKKARRAMQQLKASYGAEIEANSLIIGRKQQKKREKEKKAKMSGMNGDDDFGSRDERKMGSRSKKQSKASPMTAPVKFVSDGNLLDEEDINTPGEKNDTDIEPNSGIESMREIMKEEDGGDKHSKEENFTERASVSKEFGQFEKYSNGFGSKMLSKMGFAGPGYGLGKNGQGIAEPITATRRRKNVGLGLH